MKLRTRLTVASAVVTSLSTFLIGGFALNSSHNSGVALLDKSLNQVAVSVKGHANEALSEALYSVQQSDIALTLVYFTKDKKASVLNDSKLNVLPNPSAKEIQASLSGAITHSGIENYRFRTILLSDKEYLVVAGSLHDIDNRYRSDLIHLLLFILACLVVAGIATWELVRHDMRKVETLIETAGEISSGKTDVHISSSHGNSELDQLAESLSRMVIALRRTAEIEEQSSRRMQEFLGDASHELRTPLTVVKGYVELLSGVAMVEPEKRARAFERVGSEILRMEKLISDLLFLAEFGDVPIKEKTDVDMSEIVRSHLGDFITLNDARSITVDIEDSVHVRGSKEHLERLMTNLLGNVSRHTPTTASVRVTLRHTPGGVELVVEDGGPGLPHNAYAEGMQSFQRFDKSRSRENGGSGLGMSIIFAIAREHAGRVTLQPSDLGGLGVHIFFGNLGA